MAVVQRIQRLHPFSFDQSAHAATAATQRQSAIRAARRQAACAAALLSADLLAFAISVAAAFAAGALPGVRAGTGTPAQNLALGAAALAGIIGYFSSHEHYEHRLPFRAECQDVARGTGFAIMLTATAAFLLALGIPRVPVVAAAVAFPLSLLLLRHVARRGLSAAGLWRMNVVVVGEGAWSTQVEDALRRERGLGYDVVAHVSTSALRNGGAGTGVWSQLLAHHDAQLLVLAHDTEGRLPPSLIANLVRERVPYALLPKLDGLPMVGARHTSLGQETVMLSYRNNLRKPIARAIKVAFDLAAASAALVVLAPVLLIIAAVVGLDGGPVFYAHTRVGARGRVFRCLKFRSMVPDSEAALQALFARDPAAAEEWAHTHKLRRDPRVTWIGAILRKTSLDELPQLLNVLRLEMSLVGPRPIVSLEIPKYAEDIAYYYETRPGITGLWQVSGRSDTTYAQRVRLDSFYVKNWSIWQDFSIIARTIPAVVSGRGAG